MLFKLTLDRYEGEIGVCFDNEGKKYEICKSNLPEICENDIFTIEFDGENYSNATKSVEETEAKIEELSKRMHKLYKISKKRRKIGL